MQYAEVTDNNRAAVNEFIKKQWFSTKMAVGGRLIDMTKLDGIITLENDEIIGLCTYVIYGGECEIISLDSLNEGIGIGSELVARVIETARKLHCKMVKLLTTNDNINTIKFYQRRGFDMCRLYCNAVNMSRKLKPSIPLKGDFDIPIKHEIEFEYIL